MAPSTKAPTKPKGKPARVGRVAKGQARDAASTAAGAAQDVVGTAKEQVAQVAEQASEKAQGLLSQARDEVGGQAEEQARRLAVSLRRMCGELANMADAGGESGSPTSMLVKGVADKGAEVANFLESRGAGGMVAELQALGRRRPGTFLTAAMSAGVVAGRAAKASRATNGPKPKTGAGGGGGR